MKEGKTLSSIRRRFAARWTAAVALLADTIATESDREFGQDTLAARMAGVNRLEIEVMGKQVQSISYEIIARHEAGKPDRPESCTVNLATGVVYVHHGNASGPTRNEEFRSMDECLEKLKLLPACLDAHSCKGISPAKFHAYEIKRLFGVTVGVVGDDVVFGGKRTDAKHVAVEWARINHLFFTRNGA